MKIRIGIFRCLVVLSAVLLLGVWGVSIVSIYDDFTDTGDSSVLVVHSSLILDPAFDRGTGNAPSRPFAVLSLSAIDIIISRAPPA